MSNLGSSLGTAVAGTILVAGITATPERSYGLALAVLAVIGIVGLVAAAFLPRHLAPARRGTSAPVIRPETDAGVVSRPTVSNT